MSSPAESASSGQSRDELGWRDELRPWQRFHLKLLVLYGGTALLAVLGLAWWQYHQRMDTEMEGLRTRMMLLAASMTEMVDGDAVNGLPDAEAQAYWERAGERFTMLKDLDPDIGDLYVFRTVDPSGQFEILTDQPTGADGEVPPSEWRYAYDGSGYPKMLQGLERVVAEEEPWKDEFGWSISAYAPLRDSRGRSVGLAGVDVYARHIDEIRREVLLSTGGALLVVLLLLGAITVFVGRQIVRPLGRVIDATDAIAGGDLQVRIQPTRRDEFGVLGRYFDSMAEGLEEREFIRETFGKYVSASVADTILGERDVRLGGESREVTVLFSDLRGYSTITEQAEPQQVVALLNEYLAAMTEVIDAHGGVVIEFLGDGILAVFNAPVDLDDHAARAVDAALGMQARIAELHEAWEADGTARLWQDVGLERLVTRIGIHTGQVIAGNLGSRKRMKYAVIGDNVNIAARLEQTNKKLGTTVLMSEAVADELPEGAYDLTSQGPVPVKGRDEPVELYSLST